jgi:oligopeptidase B
MCRAHRLLPPTLAVLLFACSGPETSNRADLPEPPLGRVEPVEITHRGHTLIDHYAWLQNPEDPEVIAYLEAENAYTDAMMTHTQALQEKLFQEMSGRVEEDAPSLPWREGDYFYYWRWGEGKEEKGYPVYARRRGSLEAEEEVLIDVNEIAEGHAYTRVPFPAISPGQDIMAFAADTVGIPRYSTIRFQNLDTGELFPEAIHPAAPLMAWASDNRTLFYVRVHPSAGGPCLYRHVLGTDPSSDQMALEAVTPMLRTMGRYLLVESAPDYLYLDLDQPDSQFTVLLEPEPGQEYDFDIVDDDLYLRTNEGGAQNFKLVRAPLTALGRKNWEELVPHRSDVLLEGFEVFRDYVVLQERENGLVRIRVRPWSGEDEYEIGFSEPAYEAHLQKGNSEANILRYEYSSLTTPASVFDHNLATREKELVRRDDILGEFDPADYVSERLYARAPDGALVPISIVHPRGTEKNGENPLVLYGYGGATVEAAFDADRFSLIDRGFVYAIAHVRGGREKGVPWEKGGQGMNTRNRFTDFIAVAELLIREGYTSPDRLFAHGMSSGGLLVGAVANMRPDLFEGIVARVPWVDVLTGLTSAGAAGELGDPKEEADYRYVLSYSPYQNVEAKDYPSMLVTAALHDTQVPYWQPARWVAKLRALKTDGNVLLLKTNLEAGGHAGAFGRNERWRETAFLYAFIIDLAGIDE